MIYKKIAIIGNPGSGKSTLSLKLHKITGIPLYHIDQYFWQKNWQKVDSEIFNKIHTELCNKESWVIEGMATKLLEERFQKADIIIFLDISTQICLYRVFKRAFFNFGKVYFSSAPGCVERIPSWEFLKYIWTFDKERKPVIVKLLEQYKDQKKIVVIKNNKELDNFLNCINFYLF